MRTRKNTPGYGSDKPKSSRGQRGEGRNSSGTKSTSKFSSERKKTGDSSEKPKFYEGKKRYSESDRSKDNGFSSSKTSKKPFRKKYERSETEQQESRFKRNHRDLNKDFKPTESYISRTERNGLVRLNKFLSMAGIASRRDADQLIELGLVSVNGVVVTELGTKINPQKDIVKHDDRVIKPEKYRYVLLNKPKGFITTMDDPEGRETVMQLVASACNERIYPVGRLDRDTTGLLLFTNDGEMAKRLTHPKHEYPKLYHVELSEKIHVESLKRLLDGVSLEDGFVKADQVAFVEGSKSQKEVGIRIHSGKNRIVRRMFEHLGFKVKKLDRVMFAGLTKKDLARGRFRHLSEQEVSFLKMIR